MNLEQLYATNLFQISYYMRSIHRKFLSFYPEKYADISYYNILIELKKGQKFLKLGFLKKV